MFKIDSQPLEDHQVKLVVEAPAESFEAAKHKAARKLSQKNKIPGFRPGKAPYPIVVRQFGESVILEEALDLYIQDAYVKILEEAEIEPYGPGELENVISFDPPQFEFVVPLKPIVELCDYHALHRDYDFQPVSEKDVDEAIENLRERQAILEPVERPASEGDVVYIQLSGNRKDGEGEDGSSLVNERRAPITIRPEGDPDENAWPFPGFSRYLIGLSAGDSKTIDYKFSDDFYFEGLQGIEATYELKVEEIKSRLLPEVNDEFAQSVGEFENLEALRTTIREELEKNKLADYNQEYEEDILNEIINQSTIKYPPQMLKRESDEVLEQLKDQLSRQKSDIDLYLKTRDITMDDLLEEIKPVAEARLKKSLILLELSEAENIKVTPDDLQSETNRTLSQLSPILEKSKLPKAVEKEMVSNMVGNIMMDLIVQKTMERVKKIVSGEDTSGESDTEENSEEPISEEETPEVVEEKVEEASTDDVVLDQNDEIDLHEANTKENS
jgi:trigger factor